MNVKCKSKCPLKFDLVFTAKKAEKSIEEKEDIISPDNSNTVEDEKKDKYESAVNEDELDQLNPENFEDIEEGICKEIHFC